MSLAASLNTMRDQLEKSLHVGYAHWDELITRVERREQQPNPHRAFDDEQIWTFLVGCGYAAANTEGVGTLTRRLLGRNQVHLSHAKIWFEVLPDTPRDCEGKTHLDLAVGTIRQRTPTQSGIELDDVDAPWVCFCEMKWYSDISTGVTYDTMRNQLARVIENALAFRGFNRLAESVTVILVTPKIFAPDAAQKSRLFQYKFAEYAKQPAQLINDLETCGLEKLPNYPPNMSERVKNNLLLRWTSYDELFANLPESNLKKEISDFWQRHGDYQGRGA